MRISLACLLAFACISGSTGAQTTAPNEWTWTSGSSTVPTSCDPYIQEECGQPGVYGILGTAGPGNTPGSRSGAANWIDGSGNLWLFGGAGIDSVGTSGQLNDLWMFDSSTKEWTWIGGSNTIQVDPGCTPYHCSVNAVYGTMGVPAPGNNPGGRSLGVTWTDKAGHFWLFGGWSFGDSSAPFFGVYILNDLWEFDPSTLEWTWMGGSNVADQPGVYGVLGTPAAGNLPGGRIESSSWTDNEGHFWLFGGDGFDSLANNGMLDDLWEFDPSTTEWTWMGGSNVANQLGVYGVLGTSAPGNAPGARDNASIWFDSLGNLWLFGGDGLDSAGGYGGLNDLWEFNPSTKDWAWMAGNSTVVCTTSTSGFVSCDLRPGKYGSLGTPAVGNLPGGRESALVWIDSGGMVWLFGGDGADANGNGGLLNDLWQFDPSTQEWAWMGGSSTIPPCAGLTCFPAGVYGTLGTPGVGNIPGGRANASGWIDANNDLWVFGGGGIDAVGTVNDLNDLWEFQPPSSTAIPTFGVAPGTYTATQNVTISDSTAGAAIYYTTDGAPPTTSSTLYSGSIAVASSEILQAIAFASNHTVSAVASAAYIINVPPDFTVAVAPASMSVAAGGTGTATISLATQGGFASPVTFSCSSGLPAGASCSFSPASVTPPGAASATVTITTSATTAAIRHTSSSLLPETTLALAICCLGWRKRRRLEFLLLLAVSAAGFGLLGGCGGGASTPAPVTSTVTVTATSGSLAHSTAFSLTVN